MLKHEPETLRGLADVSASENLVLSLLLHKIILSLEKGKKSFEKFIFSLLSITCNTGEQKHEGFIGLKNTFSRAKTYVILTSIMFPSMHVTVEDFNVCDGPE